jgi:hypothetical protein
MPATETVRSLRRRLASLPLAVFLLALLMVLVTVCTLAQVSMGTFGAVETYMRSFFLYGAFPGTDWKVPFFPGGATVGLLLLVNLAAAQWDRRLLSARKIGLWVSHAGLMLLIAGEFVTGWRQVESQMAIEEGQTLNYSEDARDAELVVVDPSAPDHDRVVSVPASLLRSGRTISLPALPFTLEVKKFYPNSDLSSLPPGETAQADRGVGTRVAVREAPPVSADDRVNSPSALVEVRAGNERLGLWLLSTDLGAPQALLHEGKSYPLALRPRRYYLPFSLTLKDFRHDVYAGTDIPKNFSSLVRLQDPGRGEDRDVLIWMNNPFRHRGLSFYQASFGKNDTLSVFQVVRNPGRLIPYVSCALVFLGLLYHFALSLRNSRKPARGK